MAKTQTYTAFMKSRAKNQRAEKLDTGATHSKVEDRKIATTAKKPKKKFQDYARDPRKKNPIKLKADGTTTEDTGVISGEIRTSAPDPLKRKGKKQERVHTRIKRVGKPITSITKVRSARKRRKEATIEI